MIFRPQIILCLIWAMLPANGDAADALPYEVVFSTYFGGKKWEHARDVYADKAGNVYVVGGTSSADFPTTPGAYDRSFDTSGKEIGPAGHSDAFVIKFSPEGQLIWSTLLGGPNYDRIYAIEVDAKGYIYVAGRAGPGFPVTEGAFQTEFGGNRDNTFYGEQNGVVAKLSPDGKRLIWASYVGVGEGCRDLAIDTDGDVYLPMGWNKLSGRSMRPEWFKNAFDNALLKEPQGDDDSGVVKVKNDGSEVLWATWLGGSAFDTQMASIRVDAKKQVYVGLNTQSKDMPTTDGALMRTLAGKEDGYIAALKPDGSGLIYGTYLGGQETDIAVSTHNLAVDPEGNAYVAMITMSPNFPTTPGAYSRKHAGKSDIAIVKLSPLGAMLQSTFIGGGDDDGADGIYMDTEGNVFFAGTTSSADFPTTSGALQKKHGGDRDAVVVLLSARFDRLLYSTFIGGKAYDAGRSAYLGSLGDLYVTGATNGSGWPVRNAYQSEFAGTNDGRWGNGDCILARFRPTTRLQPKR